MYGGDPDGAIAMLHSSETAHPDDPLPYTIEAEARWWKMFCDAAEIKWGMMDSQKRGKKPGDESYFEAADRAIELAQAAIAQNDTSENHFYAGIGFALKTRLYGLRNENGSRRTMEWRRVRNFCGHLNSIRTTRTRRWESVFITFTWIHFRPS